MGHLTGRTDTSVMLPYCEGIRKAGIFDHTAGIRSLGKKGGEGGGGGKKFICLSKVNVAAHFKGEFFKPLPENP